MFKNEQTPRQASALIRLFLRSRRGEVGDCMTFRNKFREFYGLRYDHHEFASALDVMAQCEAADVVERGEFTRYIIN